MKKSRLLALLLITPLFSLAGCKENHIIVSDLKTGIQYLASERNYTFTYVGNSNNHDIIYTNNSIGIVPNNVPSATDIYIQHSQGVYRLRYNLDDYVSSEILSKGKSLWGDKYYPTMLGADVGFTSSIKSEDTSVKVSSKDFKMAFIKCIGYTSDQIVNVNSLNIAYRKSGDKQYLRFTLDYSGSQIIYDAHDFGTSKNSIVDEYVGNGGSYLTINDNFSTMRRLFKANNFVQDIYYFGEEESGYAASAYFNPNYYMSIYNGSNVGSGAIALKDKASGYYGTYYFQIEFTDQGARPSLLSKPVYDKPNVPEYYHYPSELLLFNTFEFVYKWTNQDMGGYTPQGQGYYFNNQELLENFSNNFSMSENFSGQRPLGVAIDFVKGKTDDKTVIMFYYKFVYSGQIYVMPIPFYNFGKANIAALDSIYNRYNKE
ncbi:MAG: hypothetical protein J5955_00370 [Bacilli bacterium]|nr:hypothetical protein [Bacilli bacterium]